MSAEYDKKIAFVRGMLEKRKIKASVLDAQEILEYFNRLLEEEGLTYDAEQEYSRELFWQAYELWNKDQKATEDLIESGYFGEDTEDLEDDQLGSADGGYTDEDLNNDTRIQEAAIRDYLEGVASDGFEEYRNPGDVTLDDINLGSGAYPERPDAIESYGDPTSRYPYGDLYYPVDGRMPQDFEEAEFDLDGPDGGMHPHM